MMMMENETTSSSGGDLCLKLQRTESFPFKMISNPNRPNQGVSLGPTFINGFNQGSSFISTPTTTDIYDAVSTTTTSSSSSVFPRGATTSVVAGASGSSSGSSGLKTSKRILQPFHTTAFKSPAGGGTTTTMAASLRFPFTSSQWQELERQALIYKYMVASVPIPPDLLLPISRNFISSSPDSTSTPNSYGRASCFNLRFSNNTDPEPGRCRRTDGKKWRCSRDVAPDQKYCERHMHRGRPRSRKHVEAQAAAQAQMKNNKNHNLSAAALPPTTTTTTSSSSSLHLAAAAAAAAAGKSFSGYSPKSDFKVSPFASMASCGSQYKDTRSMEWMMKEEPVPISATEQQWDQYMNSKSVGGLRNASPYQQQQYHHQETLSLNSYSGFGTNEAQNPSDECCLFLNPEFSSLDESLSSDHRETPPPRRFIDAWSNASDSNKSREASNKSCGYGNQKISPSTLSLSMSGCNSGEGEIDQIQMGLGVIDSQSNLKSQPLSWMTQVPWMNSPPPGGPLAEVLQSSTAAAIHGCSSSTNSKTSSCGGGGLNLMIEGWNYGGIGGNGGDASSPRMTTSMSSPSGVLQRTFASLSDSSGNSSPNSFTAAAKSEFALQLLNHNKLPSS